MQQKFLKNLGFLLILNIVVKPLWILGIQVMVQNKTGVEQFGMYFTVLNFGYLFFILLDPGLNNYTNREVSRSSGFVERYFINSAILKLLLGILFAAVIFFTGKYIMDYPPEFMKLTGIVALNLFLSSIIMFLRAYLAGLQLFKWDSIASVLDRTLMILICGVLLFSGRFSADFNIFWFAWAQTAAYILTAGYALLVLVRTKVRIRFNFNPGLLIRVLKKSYPFALLTLLMSFYTRIDSVMIEKIYPSGAAEAGIYAQGYKIYEAVNMIAFLFATLLLPVFSKQIAKGRPVRDIVNWSVRLLVIPAIFLAIFSFAVKTPIIELLFISETKQTARVFPLLMFAFIGVAANYIFGTLLTAKGELKFLNGISFGGLVLNVTLNALLIPSHGAPGAAIATLATQAGVALFQISRCYTLFNLKFYVKDVLKVAGLAALTVATFYFTAKAEIDQLLIAGVSAIIVITVLAASKLIDVKNLFKLMKYGEDEENQKRQS